MARTPAPQVDVPSRAEFDALEARVSALEGRVDVLEEDTVTEPPEQPDGGGIEPERIVDVIGAFGVNTFSSMDEHNVWGSWPADYRPEQVVAALQYLTGGDVDSGTGHMLRIREYHYAGRESFQRPWMAAIQAACPDVTFTLCVGANGTVADVETMLTLTSGVHWYEGLNEPNTDFGSGQVPVEQTAAIQHALWTDSDTDALILGPSIVAGMPHPEGWVTGYLGDQLDAVVDHMDWGNGHYYPPHCPDLIGDGTSLVEYVSGLRDAYRGRPVSVTEFHPSLYNSAGHGPSEPGWNGQRDAYYTLLTLLRFSEDKMDGGLWWYALFDYGQTYQCGLFPVNASNPRPAADAIRRLCLLCPDTGAERRTFQPDPLALRVAGDCSWLLTQASDGIFYLFLWRSAAEPDDNNTTDVVVSLSFAMLATTYDMLTGRTISTGNHHSLLIKLPVGVWMVRLAG